MIRSALATVLFTLAAPCSVAIWIPRWILGRWPWLGDGPIQLSLPLIGMGWALYVWCATDFVRRGRGTPAPVAAPVRLVIRGAYRYTRNPMYVGMLLVLTGESIQTRSVTLLGYAALVGMLFHAFVLLYEEPALKRRFGTDYEKYRAAVPRWHFRLRRSRGGA